MSFLSRLFGGSPSTTTDEIKEQLEAGALILDVRTEQEFAQGKIKGAVNIPVQVLSQYVDDVKSKNFPLKQEPFSRCQLLNKFTNFLG